MKKIRVKIIARGQHAHPWQAQLPCAGFPETSCEFIWWANAETYDWLVVIDDVSRDLRAPPERLACPDEHTLLVTTEPPTITRYGTAFCAQFAHVLTSHPPDTLRHPNRIYSHTGNLWFNGHRYDELHNKRFPEKTRSLSTVCSSKQQKHTLHDQRYQFCQWLKQKLPYLQIYGHGSHFVKKKYEILDPFRFHLAIENYRGTHHWTEKLADPILSGAFPIYYGCTNLGDYFPKEAFLEIDLFDKESTLKQIQDVMEDANYYSSRVEALYEARRRIMNEFNLLKMIEKIVLKEFEGASTPSRRPLYGRKQMRLKDPNDLWKHLIWSIAKLTHSP